MKSVDSIANHSFGIIYVATGDKYIAEATVSARSVKRVMPDVPILLHSDQQPDAECFDAVVQMTEFRYNCYDKVPPLQNSPFEKTLFLDTDTFVYDALDEIPALLDRFDFLLCHTPFRDPNPLPGIPAAFTELNTGVIAFRKNSLTSECLNRWLQLYGEMGHKADQPSFRRMIWEQSQASIYVLPPEYNFRTVFPGFVGGGSVVKIFHGRHKNWEPVVSKLNRSREARVMVLTPLDRFQGKILTLRSWLDLFKSWLKHRMGMQKSRK